MRGRTLISFLTILVLTLMAGVSADARGVSRPAPDPNDQGCPQDDWPYYYYRHPIIFQEVNQAGTLQFVGFGYADACKKSGKGLRGATDSTLLELENVWAPDVLEKVRNMPNVPVAQVLPGLGMPGSNVLRWDLPNIPVRFADLYNSNADTSCQYPGSTVTVCPGIPPEFGQQILADGGFERKQDKWGNMRWHFPSPQTPSDYWGAWFLSAISTKPPNPSENFYARHWATDMQTDHSDGGVYRVVLHPVDLILTGAPPSAPVDGTGAAVVPLIITNASTRSQLKTTIGWRIQGSAAWSPVAGWRPKGETAWRQYTEKVPLVRAGDMEIEVLVIGRSAGQAIDLMVNETEAIPEIYSAPSTNAYGNNVQQTTLERAVLPDLAISGTTAPGFVSCTDGGNYTVSWTVSNDSAAPITARLTVTVATGKTGSWISLDESSPIPPGSQDRSATISTGLCGDASAVTIVVNPEQNPPESSYDNNRQVVSTSIGSRNPSPVGGTPGPGPTPGNSGTDHLIVPADCIPNADWTSHYPCTNYPDLYFP